MPKVVVSSHAPPCGHSGCSQKMRAETHRQQNVCIMVEVNARRKSGTGEKGIGKAGKPLHYKGGPGSLGSNRSEITV